jgi:hypothetical protein
MIEAVALARVDAVVNFSLCHETFSYTTHEALAAGAFVVARKDAGNVWPTVLANAPQQGYAVSDQQELFAVFESGSLGQLIARASRRQGALIYGGGTAGWFAGDDLNVLAA